MTQRSDYRDSTVPRHVAIIPDGNRRWASLRGMDPWIGHEQGAQRIEELASAARDMGITHLSFWGSSMENLTKRPLLERKALMNVYEKYFTKLMHDPSVVRDEVRIRVCGYWREVLPEKLVRVLDGGIAATAQHTRHHLTFFLNYSGDYEMVEAVRAMIVGGVPAHTVSAATLKAHLLTADLPPVDFLIRTGGEPHLSAGFLMWDIANAQLYFDDVLFPDFDVAHLQTALDDYARRTRRLGK